MTTTSTSTPILDQFRLDGQVAVITGGPGTLGQAMARGLMEAGADVAIIGLRPGKAERVAKRLQEETRAEARAETRARRCLGVGANVLDAEALHAAKAAVEAELGPPSILVNAAGGNVAGATLAPETPLFGCDPEAMEKVVALNFHGTFLPTQVFGPGLVESGRGVVLNVSSMTATQAITRVGGYASAKAAVEQYTRWLAVEAAQRYGGALRVVAIAPSFFLAEQNRALLLSEDGSLTARGEAIIRQTPAGRFGDPADLAGAVVWLCSPAAAFVTGIVVPIDGGFSAYGGL